MPSDGTVNISYFTQIESWLASPLVELQVAMNQLTSNTKKNTVAIHGSEINVSRSNGHFKQNNRHLTSRMIKPCRATPWAKIRCVRPHNEPPTLIDGAHSTNTLRFLLSFRPIRVSQGYDIDVMNRVGGRLAMPDEQIAKGRLFVCGHSTVVNTYFITVKRFIH